MKYKWLTKNYKNDNLIYFFNGWGMDENILNIFVVTCSCAPIQIQTGNPQLRRLLLYSVELWELLIISIFLLTLPSELTI